MLNVDDGKTARCGDGVRVIPINADVAGAKHITAAMSVGRRRRLFNMIPCTLSYYGEVLIVDMIDGCVANDVLIL